MSSVEFRVAMAALPEPPASAPPHWDHWRRDLWWRAQNYSVESFWDWPCVYHTMLTMHFPMGAQLAYLQRDWSRWEPIVSNRENEADYRNMVNQCAHVKRWEDTTGQRLNELDKIFEFGGGYGALALVAHKLGFRGRYLIRDLPEFCLLQDWYLGQYGVTVEHVDTPPNWPDLFIGLYSISEAPLGERHFWTACNKGYLILYSGQWADVDNHKWAREMVEEVESTSVSKWIWSVQQMESRPDWYLIGRHK